MADADVTRSFLSKDDWSWTILLTFHNGSRFIESALNSISIALQRLVDRHSPGHQLDVIIVDDFSEEEESAKLHMAAERLTLPALCGLTIVRLPVNAGVSAARREGLRRARRSFIHILDQDDEVKPDFYVSVLDSYLKNIVSAEDLTMWIGGCEDIDAQGNVKDTADAKDPAHWDRMLNDVNRWLSGGSQVRSPGMVVLSPLLRDEVERYFSFLDRGVDGSDDYWMFVYLLKRGAHFVVLDNIVFRYREHEHNQSVGHDFIGSARRGLLIMRNESVLLPREYSIVAARYRLLTKLQQHSQSRPMKLLAYVSAPLATWRLLRAEL